MSTEPRIFYPCWQETIITIYANPGASITYLCRRTKVTYSFIYSLIYKMHGLGLVTMEKQDRSQSISLTSHGERIAELLTQVMGTVQSDSKRNEKRRK